MARAIKTVFYALDVVNQGMQEKQSITVRCVDIEDLEKQGISRRTAENTKKELGIRSYRKMRQWYWSIHTGE